MKSNDGVSTCGCMLISLALQQLFNAACHEPSIPAKHGTVTRETLQTETSPDAGIYPLLHGRIACDRVPPS
jgi:hypothetical protein